MMSVYPFQLKAWVVRKSKRRKANAVDKKIYFFLSHSHQSSSSWFWNLQICFVQFLHLSCLISHNNSRLVYQPCEPSQGRKCQSCQNPHKRINTNVYFSSIPVISFYVKEPLRDLYSASGRRFKQSIHTEFALVSVTTQKLVSWLFNSFSVVNTLRLR